MQIRVSKPELLTSRMCSWLLASYLLLYFEESSTVPLLRPHVTLGAGSPLTIVLKKAFLPVKSKKKKRRMSHNIVAVRTVASSVFPSCNMTFTLLNGCSHWLPGKVRGRLSRREALNMLSDDNPGNSGPFLDSHWEGREGNKKKQKFLFNRWKKS